MPNWCYIEAALHGERDSVDALERMLGRCPVHADATDPHGRVWLADVLAAAGIQEPAVSTRGWLTGWKRDGDAIRLCAEAAWDAWPLVETVDAVLSQDEYRGARLCLRAEEPNSGLFVNTDADGTYFPERYYLDYEMPDGSGGVEYFNSEAALCAFLNESFPDVGGRCLADVERAEQPEEGWFVVHEFAGMTHALVMMTGPEPAGR